MCSKLYLPTVCALLATGHAASLAQEQKADPLQAFIGVSDKRIARHAFFTKVTMLKWTKNPPFVFYLERPQRDTKHYERLVVNSYLPFLERLLKIFEREYAKPLGLARRGAAPGFAFAVLNSRGSYLNYAQAVKVDSLHHSRAHYDPRLQLAVTYLDTFSSGNRGPVERSAMLHEFVHAMQHAYSTTGRMPRPSWFNEGLAEFHSASTNSAESLESPLLKSRHLEMLSSVLQYSELNSLFAPLPDLVASESYRDTLKRAKARGAKMSLALRVFYAQSAAFAEFLCRGEGGKHKPKFLRFTNSVMRGGPGLGGFEQAFGKSTLPELEASFRKYLAAEALRRLRVQIGGPGVALPADVAAKVGAMPPPELYDSSKLGWRDYELGARIAAARSRCVHGDYDAALALLPSAAGDVKNDDVALAQRVRSRVVEIRRMREGLLAKLLGKKKRMAPLVDGKRQGGTLIARSGDELTLRNRGQTFKLPLTVLGPRNLAKELGKQKLVKRASWQNAWLNWLGGDKPKKAFRHLEDASDESKALREDTKGVVDPSRGATAAALSQILNIVPARKPAVAFDQLDTLCTLILDHRKSGLIRSRMEGLRQCVKALAQRAFSIEDPRCLGVSVPVKRAADGRISLEYKGDGDGIAADFRFHKALSASNMKGYPQLATSETGLLRRGKFYELVGSGVFAWASPLRGPLVLELHYEMTGVGIWSLVMSVQPGGGYIRASVGGQVDIFDPKTRLTDSIGSVGMIIAEQVHRLRLEFDGKSKLVCSLDGKTTAELTKVGSLVSGFAGLMVHCSTPLRIHAIKIVGKPDSRDGPRLRAAFVERILARLK